MYNVDIMLRAPPGEIIMLIRIYQRMSERFQKNCNYLKIVKIATLVKTGSLLKLRIVTIILIFKVFIQSSQFETPLHQVLIWQRNGVIIFISGWSFPGSIIVVVVVVVIVVVVVG